MDPVSDTFLVGLAEISAGLTGLFLVGMIFYIQTGYDRIERSREVVEPYFRAATTITFIAYAIPLFVSLTLVALPIGWSRLLFLVLVLGLAVTDVLTVATVRTVMRVTRLGLLMMMEVIGTAVVALMVILPLATGGLSPDREDLVPALLLSLAVAFLGTCVLALTLFDIARFERSEAPLAVPELPERTADTTDPTDESASDQGTDPLH
ncbi:MAG: hypothetical protein QNJ77_07940 [Acidimicrobiia bacterium]|nr:hypothetical protein [Acidimicrobiia bacterium]